ncbi:MAG: Lrp/AsnC ligand binding domain-containing protein [Candidatus Bathyarchaeia archaeon]
MYRDLISACILIRSSTGRYMDVVESLSKIPQIKNIFPVLGRWDVVADIEASDIEELTRIVRKIGRLGSVVFTETLVEMKGVEAHG